MSGDKMVVSSNPAHHSFDTLYEKQKQFQKKVTPVDVNLPTDSPTMFQYHMTAMTEELGEVLKADKRWKTHRNTTHDRNEKLDEIADCFITLMNIGIWSGYSQDEIYEGIFCKIDENNSRLDNAAVVQKE